MKDSMVLLLSHFAPTPSIYFVLLMEIFSLKYKVLLWELVVLGSRSVLDLRLCSNCLDTDGAPDMLLSFTPLGILF